MTPPHEAALQVAQHLRLRLARAGLSLREVDRRLGWREGRLARLLRRGSELRVGELYAILAAVGIEARAFFAELLELEARPAGPPQRETPYSSGLLSAADAAEFPRASEVIELVRALVEEGTSGAKQKA